MHPPRLLRPRYLCLYGCILLAVSRLASGSSPSGLDSPEPVGPFFNGTFPNTPPGDPSGWAVENAFPALTFTDPLMMAEIPGRNEFLVVGKIGKMWRFPKNPAATLAQRIEVLDHTSKTETSEDQGFYSLAFHPRFAIGGAVGENQVFVCYSRRAFAGVDDNDRTYWTVSRFTWLPASGTLDPDSEEILISQYDPHRYHNGGATFFGDDGFLYITAGDGGLGGDALDNSQRINVGFFGGVLRIDVDNDPAKSHPIRRQPSEDPGWEVNVKPAEWPGSFSQGYGIPNTNPWQDAGGSVLEEFYAIGLRSPHSAHFDRETDEIWVGDVGEANREELTRIANGSNCQWAYREGTRSTSKNKPIPLIGTEMVPVYDYTHTEGASIIGGMRYRGTKWSNFLADKVIFGDHITGRIWSLELTAGAPIVSEMLSSFDTGYKKGLCGFATDSEGEIYMMNLGGANSPNGKIMKLAIPALSAEPPQLLSQTGVFTDLATLATAPGVIPYGLPNPLWSDAAAKQRWVILPNDGTFDSTAEDIVFSEDESWKFPAGTIFVKHFEVNTDANDPAAIRRLETRFLICTAAGGKYGVTYKWNEQGTDAELMEQGLDEAYSYSMGDGSVEQRLWTFPSRGDCMLCHNDAAGQALGFKTAHLNSSFHYPSTGKTANQLATLNALGAFNVSLTATQLGNYIEARALEDETAPLEHRVRSYLDTNCSHCHLPEGPGAGFDARLGTPLDFQNLINGIPQRYEALGPDGRYIAPGNNSLSAVNVRASAVNNGDAMPPLAKNMAHANGVAALQAYISGLSPAQFVPPLGPGPQARYVRLTSLTGRSRFATVAEFSILNPDGYPIPHQEITATYTRNGIPATSMPGSLPSETTDGNLGSSTNFWQSFKGPTNAETPNHPHELTFDLGITREITGFTYYPRTNADDGRIFQYKVEYSTDGTSWTLFNAGTWPNDATPRTFAPGYNKRPVRAQIAGPAETSARDFDVTVVFDMDVTNFTPSDLQVAGGSVSALRGSGYYYVASISADPGATLVTVSVPADVVSPLGPHGEGSFASSALPVTISPDVTAPESPPGLVAAPALQWVDLTWGEANDDVAVTGYEVRRGTTLLATITGTSYRDSGLEPDTAYDYSVTALDAAGNSSIPATVSTATLPDEDAPSTPEDLAATPYPDSVDLTWSASTDEVGVDGYQITRGNTVIATVQGTSYTDTGLQSGTPYQYKVAAFDEAGNLSGPATVSTATLGDSIPPDPPPALAATPFLTSIRLSWEPAPDAVEYVVKRGQLTLATISGLEYTDTGLDSGTLYQYQVIAVDAEGNASEPASVSATTLPDEEPPSVPESLVATPSHQSVQLNWTASTDLVGVVAGYRIERNNIVIATVQTPGFNDTGLLPDTGYTYKVRAFDEAGNFSAAATVSTSTLKDESPPQAPGNLAGAPHLRSIDLSWDAATDEVGVTGYIIRRDGNLIATVEELAYSDTGLEPDTLYSYEVRARDAAGNLSATAVLAISTSPDETPPDAPPNLVAAPGYHSVDLTWDASSDDVVAYQIWRGNDFLGSVLNLAYSDTGLADGTAYIYRVIAIDAAGNASAASEVHVETLGFEAWLDEHGLPGEVSGDADHGGLDNLTEYYLGMDPNDSADDLAFRITCQPGESAASITFPDLVPAGDYHLHASNSLDDVRTVGKRVLTITRAEIEAMTPAERSGHVEEAPLPPGPRGFFLLIFEPTGN